MGKTNVVKLPNCPPADDSKAPMVLCAVSTHFKEEFSYKYDKKVDEWYIDVRASTVDRLISFLCQCKSAIPVFGREAQK